MQRLPKRADEIGREDAVAEAAVQLGELFPEVDSIANVTELKHQLEKHARGAGNVRETIYLLLGFREKLREQTSTPTISP